MTTAETVPTASGRFDLRADLPASLVVFLISLPLSMGIALASGAPPAVGLMTALVGGIVVGALGGAPLQISGPSAGQAVLVLQVVQTHGLKALGPVVLIGGTLQLIAGRAKLGGYFRAVSPAVIRGMLSSIGILIIVGQFHVMLDQPIPGGGLKNIVAIPSGIMRAFAGEGPTYHHLAAAVGVGTLAIVVLWEWLKPRVLKKIPGALLGVVFAAVVAQVIDLPIMYVAVPSSLVELVSVPSAESMAFFLNPDVVFSGVALAFVATAETLLCSIAVSKMANGPVTEYNRELSAQGVGNIVCGLLGALPVVGVISRSTASVEAGAQSRFTNILHAVWIALFVIFLPDVLSLVPTSSLAAILIYIGLKLLRPRAVMHLVRYDKSILFVFFATVAGIVAIDLLKGIIIGLILSTMKLVYALSHLEIEREILDNGRIDFHFHGSATFLALPTLGNELETIQPGTELHFHIEELEFIDHACLDLLSDFKVRHEKTGGSVVIEWDTLVARYTKGGKKALARQELRDDEENAFHEPHEPDYRDDIPILDSDIYDDDNEHHSF